MKLTLVDWLTGCPRKYDWAENAINRSSSEKTIISDSNLVDDTTKDVKQADNSKLENVFHTKYIHSEIYTWLWMGGLLPFTHH